MLSSINHRDRIGAVIATVLAIATAALLSGCGGSSSSESGGAAVAKPGGTLTVALSQDPATLTPEESLTGQSAIVIGQINETLFTTTASAGIQPLLATKMTTSPDGLTSTITLRSGVKFSNGQPMTSSDVVFSIEAAKRNPYYGEMYQGITSVSAPSPTTVVIRCKEPVAALKPVLASAISAIVPKNYGGKSAKEFSEHPIGTGPFKLKSWAHEESVTLVKNPSYWQSGEPLLNEVVFRIIPEDNSRIAQLRGGQINVVQLPTFSQVPGLEQAGLKKSQSPFISMGAMVLNQHKPLFEDSRIRKAIDLAIDRQAVANVAFAGLGKPAESMFPPALPYYDKSLVPPKRNLEEAKALVAAAVKDGVDPSFGMLINAEEAVTLSEAQIIQQDLKQIGLNPTIESFGLAAMLSKLEEGKFDATLTGYFSGVSDPTEATSIVINYMLKPSGGDIHRFESIASRANAELQPSKRQQLYNEFQTDVAEERGAIAVWYSEEPWIMGSDVAGFEQTVTNVLNLTKTGFSG